MFYFPSSSYLTKPDVYITHYAAWPLTVDMEVLRCVMLSVANVASGCSCQAEIRSGPQRSGKLNFFLCNIFKYEALRTNRCFYQTSHNSLWSHKRLYTTLFTYAILLPRTCKQTCPGQISRILCWMGAVMQAYSGDVGKKKSNIFLYTVQILNYLSFTVISKQKIILILGLGNISNILDVSRLVVCGM